MNREQKRETSRRFWQSRIAQGLCPRCGNPKGDTLYCTDCKIAKQAYSMGQHDIRKLRQLCIRCGKQPVARLTECVECRKARARQRQERKERKQLANPRAAQAGQ